MLTFWAMSIFLLRMSIFWIVIRSSIRIIIFKEPVPSNIVLFVVTKPTIISHWHEELSTESDIFNRLQKRKRFSIRLYFSYFLSTFDWVYRFWWFFLFEIWCFACDPISIWSLQMGFMIKRLMFFFVILIISSIS